MPSERDTCAMDYPLATILSTCALNSASYLRSVRLSFLASMFLQF